MDLNANELGIVGLILVALFERRPLLARLSAFVDRILAGNKSGQDRKAGGGGSGNSGLRKVLQEFKEADSRTETAEKLAAIMRCVESIKERQEEDGGS